MFQQSNSRNLRSRGSKVKKIIQTAVLLVVAVWLLYQIKHSQVKKIEHIGDDQHDVSNRDEDMYLGRKEKAGSQNEVGVDNDRGSFDSVSETKEAEEGQADALEQHPEEKDGEATPIKEHDGSKEDIMQDGRKVNQQEQQHNEDDIADSHINGGQEITGKTLNKEAGEVLQLPSEEDSDNSLGGQTENRHTQSDIGVTGDNTGGVVPEEKNSDDEHAILNIFSEQSNAVSTNNEVAETDTLEAQGDSNPDAETSDHHTMEAANTGTKSEEEVGNNMVMLADGDQPPKREATESNADSTSQADIAGSNSLEQEKTNTRFEDDPARLSQADESKDNASEGGEQESHIDNASDAEVTNHAVEGNLDPKFSDGLASSSHIHSDENVDKPAKVDAAKVEEVESQGDISATEADNSGSGSPDETKARTVSDGEANYSSHSNEQVNSETPTNDKTISEAAESRGNSASETESTSNSDAEEVKSEPKPSK